MNESKGHQNYVVCLVLFNPAHAIGGTELFLKRYGRLLTRDGIDYIVVTIRQNVDDVPFFEVIHRILLSLLAVMRMIYYYGRNRFSIVHVQDSSYAGFSGMIVAKLLHLPLIVHCHVDPFGYPKRAGRKVGFLLRIVHILEKIVADNADKVVVVNRGMKRALSLLGVSEDRIVVVPMGVSSFRYKKKDKIDIRREFGIDDKAFTVGYCGRLSPEKGTQVLIKAFSKAYMCNEVPSDSRLLIVGDGVERGRLRSLATEMGTADAVIFTGLRKDVHRILNAIDLFVLPSLTEGSPLSLLEAMMAGKPIIASRIPAICEIVRDEYNGLLTQPGDEHALKETIVQLYGQSELRRNLSTEAKRYVVQYKDIERTYRRLLDTYSLVLSNQA